MPLSASQLVPGVFTDIDSTQAVGGVAVEPFTTVLIAQKTSAGTLAPLTFERVFSGESASLKAGAGSIGAEMAGAWFKNNKNTPLYLVLMDDDGAATSAEKTITFGGAPTAAGTVFLYINGFLIRVGVAVGDTITTIAAAVAAAVTANVDLPYTATAAIGVVTLVAKNGGTLGSTIDVRVNYNVGEETPAGVTVVIAESVAGATDPDMATAIAAVPDDIVNLWITSLTDATNIGYLKTELDTRWDPTVQLDGTGIMAAAQDTAANVIIFGDTLNSERLTAIDAGVDAPTPSYLLAGMAAGKVAESASVDVAQPFTTLELVGALGDTLTNKRSLAERNAILNAGVSTHKIDSTGIVRIERMVTTYKTNGAGAPDTAYLNLNTPLQLSFYRQTLIAWILTRYPRHKLANDGTAFGSGQPIVTPQDLKAASLGHYDELGRLGIVDPAERELFKSDSVFARDATNRGRVNATLVPTLIGQFYQLDAIISFRL